MFKKPSLKLEHPKQKSINLVQMFELFGYIICMYTIYIIIYTLNYSFKVLV